MDARIIISVVLLAIVVIVVCIATGIMKLLEHICLWRKYNYLKEYGFIRDIDNGCIWNDKFFGNFVRGDIIVGELDVRLRSYRELERYIRQMIHER